MTKLGSTIPPEEVLTRAFDTEPAYLLVTPESGWIETLNIDTERGIVKYRPADGPILVRKGCRISFDFETKSIKIDGLKIPTTRADDAPIEWPL